MLSRPLMRGCASLLVGIIGIVTTSPMSRAADAAPVEGAASGGRGAEQEARLLFSQGQIHYSLGEYDLAVVAFRRAYELSQAPGLLFNIAQANRLNGQCKQALEAYRHFVRLVPTSQYRAEADTQIAALVVRCGDAPSQAAASEPPRSEAAKPAQTIVATTAPVLEVRHVEATPPRWSRRRKTAAALLAGGVVLGLVTGGLAWWNNGRYDDWRTEDQRLMGSTSTDPQIWLGDQQRNDALLSSVHRMDTLDATLAGVAIAAVIASAILLVTSER